MPPDKLNTLSEAQADAEGFKRLTYPIDMNVEQWILDNIVTDMQRGGIPCCLVVQPTGLEVWRKPRCMR